MSALYLCFRDKANGRAGKRKQAKSEHRDLPLYLHPLPRPSSVPQDCPLCDLSRKTSLAGEEGHAARDGRLLQSIKTRTRTKRQNKKHTGQAPLGHTRPTFPEQRVTEA